MRDEAVRPSRRASSRDRNRLAAHGRVGARPCRCTAISRRSAGRADLAVGGRSRGSTDRLVDRHGVDSAPRRLPFQPGLLRSGTALALDRISAVACCHARHRRFADHTYVCGGGGRAGLPLGIKGQAIELAQRPPPAERATGLRRVTLPRPVVGGPLASALHGPYFRRGGRPIRGPSTGDSDRPVGRASPRRRTRQLGGVTTNESLEVGPEKQHPPGQPRIVQGDLCPGTDLLRRRFRSDTQQ